MSMTDWFKLSNFNAGYLVAKFSWADKVSVHPVSSSLLLYFEKKNKMQKNTEKNYLKTTNNRTKISAFLI